MNYKLITLTILSLCTSVSAQIVYDSNAKCLWKTAEKNMGKDLRESIIMDACYYMAKAYSEGKTLDESIEAGTRWIRPSKELSKQELSELEELMKD